MHWHWGARTAAQLVTVVLGARIATGLDDRTAALLGTSALGATTEDQVVTLALGAGSAAQLVTVPLGT